MSKNPYGTHSKFKLNKGVYSFGVVLALLRADKKEIENKNFDTGILRAVDKNLIIAEIDEAMKVLEREGKNESYNG